MATPVWKELIDTAPPRFLHGGPVPLQQHPLYGAALARIGATTRAFACGGTQGAPCGWALVLVRRWPGLGDVAMLARGPVWSAEASVAHRRSGLLEMVHLLRQRFRVVIATPDPVSGADPLAGQGWLPMVTGGSLARMDLSGGAPELRARMHGKWRNRLVRAETADLDVSLGPMPDDPGHWLLHAEAAQAQHRRYKRLPPAFALAWRQAGGPRATLLATARVDGVPVAGMLFLRHGGMASYHVGWASDAGRACDAHRLLLFRAALRLAKAGHRTLDLGTLDTVTTPGLARFKLGAGAYTVHLGSTRIHAPGTALVAWLTGEGHRTARGNTPDCRARAPG